MLVGRVSGDDANILKGSGGVDRVGAGFAENDRQIFGDLTIDLAHLLDGGVSIGGNEDVAQLAKNPWYAAGVDVGVGAVQIAQ